MLIHPWVIGKSPAAISETAMRCSSCCRISQRPPADGAWHRLGRCPSAGVSETERLRPVVIGPPAGRQRPGAGGDGGFSCRLSWRFRQGSRAAPGFGPGPAGRHRIEPQTLHPKTWSQAHAGRHLSPSAKPTSVSNDILVSVSTKNGYFSCFISSRRSEANSFYTCRFWGSPAKLTFSHCLFISSFPITSRPACSQVGHQLGSLL